MSLGHSHFSDFSKQFSEGGLISAFLSASLMTGAITMNIEVLSKQVIVSQEARLKLNDLGKFYWKRLSSCCVDCAYLNNSNRGDNTHDLVLWGIHPPCFIFLRFLWGRYSAACSSNIAEVKLNESGYKASCHLLLRSCSRQESEELCPCLPIRFYIPAALQAHFKNL